MKEADLSGSFENFIDRNTPNWGVRMKFPSGKERIIGPMDEFIADIVLVQGINPDPPKINNETCISAKKVRL